MVAKGNYQGTVAADIIEVRFAFSGKVTVVNKRAGEAVKKGEVLASLDRKQLQAELDLQLAQYEKVRAGFEIFAHRHPDPGDDITKFLKTGEQADLNAAVKQVELAKMRLDQTTLISPVNGVVTNDGGCRIGLYVTPASNAFSILDMDSLRLRAEMESEDLERFTQETEVKVSLGGRELPGKTRLPYPIGKTWVVDVTLGETIGLTAGMRGEIRLKEESTPG